MASVIMNHNDALTEREAQRDGTFIRDDAWFEDASVEIRIDVKQFCTIAAQAKRNRALCRRRSGEVALVAPGRDFDYEAFSGAPRRYTLSAAWRIIFPQLS
jgi:hypothetical protein